MMIGQTALWKRVDCPGHDAARLVACKDGWRLSGTAVFLSKVGPCQLSYAVEADASWDVGRASIDGFIGDRPVEPHIVRGEGGWLLDGAPVAEGPDLRTLDFSFTPATNILQLRRSAPQIGQSTEIPALWFDIEAETLSVLPQTYHRISDTHYRYEAPTVGYTAVLVLDANGFVADYPGLWLSVVLTD